MSEETPSRILVCANGPSAKDIRQLLEQAGHAVGWHTLGVVDPEDVPTYDLVVLVDDRQDRHVPHFCRRLRARLADSFVPILVVTEDHAPAARLLTLESGADAYLLRPFAPGELLAQVQALLRLKRLHDQLSAKTAECHRVHKRLQQAYEELDHELQLARRIQQGLLPQALPELPWVRFAVHYRPCGRVGGDFYDVFRLDENHVGFYVADVMGHGMPASLLTIFLKKAVRAKEIFGRQYRLLPPNEVLQHLNRDLIEQALAETPFITMVYALLNRQNGTFSYSRAGHPYPLYLPRSGEPEFWQVEGTLLGVFDTQFPVRTQQLQPGDKVLLFTDGLDSGGADGQRTGFQPLLTSASRHRGLPIAELVEQVARDLLAQAGQPDDFTLLGLEMTRE
jgi:sigma-B regulation protein RsbU (phosphoserine phosphatase)